jgi:hypothetical protein
MNIIQLSLNLKHKELPPLIIIIMTLLEKSSTMAKKFLDQIRDAIRFHMPDRRSPWCLTGEGLLTEPGSRPQISREYPYLWKSFYPTPAPPLKNDYYKKPKLHYRGGEIFLGEGGACVPPSPRNPQSNLAEEGFSVLAGFLAGVMTAGLPGI